ncbi:MAG: DUF4157 domain-containing protein [Anaerolineae bacterium]
MRHVGHDLNADALLQAGKRPARLAEASGSAATGLASLQRAVGNRTYGAVIQAKLHVNEPGDVYEQEADRVADMVMRMPDPVASAANEDPPPSGAHPAHVGPGMPRIALQREMSSVPTGVQRRSEDEDGNDVPLQAKAESGGLTVSHAVEGQIAALRGGGQPLPEATRSFFEPRLGFALSKVRVHSNSQAAETARAVNARAFTVGRDVVFGAGEYAPGTTEGRRLLAHELVHVTQQVNSVPSEMTSGSAVRGTIRRSLLGGIVGGVTGAVGGAVVGGILGGPFGAVAGGIIGAVGGAAVGDTASTRSRALTQPETDYATEIYGDSVNYSVITITRDSLISTGAPKTLGNTIHLRSQWGGDIFQSDESMALTHKGLELLIHEMGHVWQYQNGGLAYIGDSLWAQLRGALGSGSRDAAYAWREAHNAGTPWEEWNPEQQAEAIEEYNKALRRAKDGTATSANFTLMTTLEPYMEKVRRGEGAPQFSLPGAIGGGLIGAGMGALIGAAAGGPIGALVGAGIGGLAGAIFGGG